MAKNPKSYRKRKRGQLSRREMEALLLFRAKCLEVVNAMNLNKEKK